MTDNRAVPTVQLDNDHLRVTEWRFGPGAATGYHRHAHDYVVVPVLNGELELIGLDGCYTRVRLQQGKSYSAMQALSTTSSMPAPVSSPSLKSN
jgi:beta-alanine degradation protein BauB